MSSFDATGAELFRELDKQLAGLVSAVKPARRAQMAKRLARVLRAGQQARIRRQENGDESRYQARHKKNLRVQGGVKFLWRGEVRELRNWRTTGRGEHRQITGYDVDRGGLRSFFKADIDRYLEIDTHATSRKSRNNQRQQMFRYLRLSRFMHAKGSADKILVGFDGAAAAIARIHQYGLVDTINEYAKAKYPQRELLALTQRDWWAITEEFYNALIAAL